MNDLYGTKESSDYQHKQLSQQLLLQGFYKADYGRQMPYSSANAPMLESNAMNAQLPNEWARKISSPGSVLLAPFTSDATRQESRQLVLVSLLTILLADQIVTVTEGSFAGLKLEAAQVKYVVMTGGLACVYFLITYAVDVWRDWLQSEYVRLPSRVEMQALKDTVTGDVNRYAERWHFLTQERERLAQLREEKLKALTEAWKPIGSDQPEPPPTSLEEWRQQRKPLDDLLQRQREFQEYCANDGLTLVETELQEMARSDSLGTQKARMHFWLQTYNRALTLNRIRLGTEVVFPVAFGLFAVMSAARYLWGG